MTRKQGMFLQGMNRGAWTQVWNILQRKVWGKKKIILVTTQKKDDVATNICSVSERNNTGGLTVQRASHQENSKHFCVFFNRYSFNSRHFSLSHPCKWCQKVGIHITIRPIDLVNIVTMPT